MNIINLNINLLIEDWVPTIHWHIEKIKLMIYIQNQQIIHRVKHSNTHHIILNIEQFEL